MKTKEKDKEGEDDPGKESPQDTDQTAKLEAEIDSLKQKNAWLTDESKKNASKYRTLRDSVGESEKAALEKAGKFQELYELAKTEKESLVDKNEQLNNTLYEQTFITFFEHK